MRFGVDFEQDTNQTEREVYGMMCQEVIELMQRYLDRDLDDTEYDRMLDHLQRCPDCTELFERLTNLSQELERLPKVTPPFSLVDAILPKLDQLDAAALESAETATAVPGAADPAPASTRPGGWRRKMKAWVSLPVFGGVVAAGLVFGFFIIQYQESQTGTNADGLLSATEAAQQKTTSTPQAAGGVNRSMMNDQKGEASGAGSAGEVAPVVPPAAKETPSASGGAAASDAPNAAPGAGAAAPATTGGAAKQPAAGSGAAGGSAPATKSAPPASGAGQATPPESAPADGGDRGAGADAAAGGANPAGSSASPASPSAGGGTAPASPSGGSDSAAPAPFGGAAPTVPPQPQAAAPQAPAAGTPAADQPAADAAAADRTSAAGTAPGAATGGGGSAQQDAAAQTKRAEEDSAAAASPRFDKSGAGAQMGITAMTAPAKQLATADGTYTALIQDGRVQVNDKQGGIAFTSKYTFSDPAQLTFVSWSADYRLTYRVQFSASASKTFVIDMKRSTESEQ